MLLATNTLRPPTDTAWPVLSENGSVPAADGALERIGLSARGLVIARADTRRVERAARATELRTVLDQEFGVELGDDGLAASVRTHCTGE